MSDVSVIENPLETVSGTDEDDVAVAVVIRDDAIPVEPRRPLARHVVTEGRGDDRREMARLGAVVVHREIGTIPDAHGPAVVVEAGLQPTLGDHPRTAD